MASASFNQTMPAAGTNALLPPPGTNWLAAIGPSLSFLMIGSTMSSILIAMLFALLFFSTPGIRRKPIFICNIISILLGIAHGIFSGYENIHGILSPDLPQRPGMLIVYGCFDSLTPILVDTILLLRLYAVFPPSQTPRIRFIAIMAFPVLLKIGRIVNITIYLANYAQKIHASAVSNTSAGAASVLVTSKFPNVKIEWFFQIFDDAYSSLIFLLRLHVGSPRSSQIASQSTSSFTQRLKTLFWISVTNFVFPVMLSIAQLVIYMASSNYLLALYVEMANFHLTIIGVVFATLWSTADGHMRGHKSSEPTETNVSAFVVARMSGPDASVATRLELQEPSEGRAGRDEEKAVDVPRSPYRLEASMSSLERPQGLAA